MDIVVNEWLLEYLLPSARAEELELATRFINGWVSRSDRVLIRRSSPFASKFYRYMAHSGCDSACRERFSKLFSFLFLDSERTRILDDCDIQGLPEDLASEIPSDDRYLIELWHSVPGSAIVTTDSKLKRSLQQHSPSAEIYLLEEFFQKHLA
jgi:hypothetical protein